jgi:hypothetical protein
VYYFTIATLSMYNAATAAFTATVDRVIGNVAYRATATYDFLTAAIFSNHPTLSLVVNMTLIVHTINEALVLAICLHGSATSIASTLINEFIVEGTAGTVISTFGNADNVYYLGYNPECTAWMIKNEEGTVEEIRTILEENFILGEVDTQKAADFGEQDAPAVEVEEEEAEAAQSGEQEAAAA